MGRREGRRKPTRKEKIAESNRLKAEKKNKPLPALSVDGKEVAASGLEGLIPLRFENMSATEVIKRIRKA